MDMYARDILREVAFATRMLSKYTPEAAETFNKFMEATLETGTLPLKIKELILVGIGVAIRCEPCVILHIRKALEAGASPQEIAEAIALAALMGGGPVVASSAKAFRALEELTERRKRFSH